MLEMPGYEELAEDGRRIINAPELEDNPPS